MVENIVFYNPRNSSQFKIYGFYWLEENNAYVRLPIKSLPTIKNINEGVAYHAYDTAGGQIHFVTNSTQLLIKVKLLKSNGITWMSDVGQGGFDCYLGDDYHNLQFLSVSKFLKNNTEYEATLFKDLSEKERLVVLNFPLYNGVVELEIGLDKNSILKQPPNLMNEKIVIYGTSIVQGGCVNRPGLAYSNILSRLLSCETINLGFSGSAYGEEELAYLVSSIENVKLFILDYEANASPNNTYQSSLENFIKIIRSRHPNSYILVCSQIIFNRELFCSKTKDLRMSNLQFQDSLIKTMQLTDNKLLFLDCSNIFPKRYSEYTVDGIHPNDIGMEKLAMAIYQKIRQYF